MNEQIKYRSLIEGSAAYKQLISDVDGGHMSSAYVLLSPDRTALRLLCRLFVAAAVGGREDPLRFSRVMDGSYLDIIDLPRPSEDKGQRKLLAEDVEYLLSTAYMTPSELPKKYYILGPDEPIAEGQQNKLLKTLEEPPASACFVLLARGENELLPTVRSRCSLVHVHEFTEQQIYDELLRYHADAVSVGLAAACCRGSLEAAERMVADKKYRYMYELAFSILLHMQRSPQILHQAGIVSVYKDSLSELVDFLEIILRDVAVYNSGHPELIKMRNSSADIVALSREYTTETVLRLFPVLSHIRARIALNGNANSMIDELLFSILEVKAKCQK